jgi:hypothetical protein
LPADHLQTVQELWSRDPEAYLHAVAPGVYAMLAAAARLRVSCQ